MRAYSTLIGKYATYVGLCKNKNDFNPHWNRLTNFVPDLMRLNNYNYLPLTRITLGTLLDSNWYYERYLSKKCKLYIKSFLGICVLFKGECINDVKKFGLVFYYFYKSDMRCAIYDANTKMTYNDLGFIEYYKLKNYYNNEDNYKCPNDKMKYLTDL